MQCQTISLCTLLFSLGDTGGASFPHAVHDATRKLSQSLSVRACHRMRWDSRFYVLCCVIQPIVRYSSLTNYHTSALSPNVWQLVHTCKIAGIVVSLLLAFSLYVLHFHILPICFAYLTPITQDICSIYPRYKVWKMSVLSSYSRSASYA